MTLREFINKHVPANMTIKVVFPRHNKTAMGKPADFKNEVKFLNAFVFDFQISNGLTGYHCLIWITPDKDDPILDIN